MEAICWFCKRPVQGKVERHHIIPKRTFRRGQDHRRGNIAPVCSACHRRFHQTIDDPRLSRAGTLKLFASINYGEGIFSE